MARHRRSSARARSGSSPAPASPSSATTSSSATSCPSGSRRSQAGEVPFHEPGLDGAARAQPRAAPFTLDVGEARRRRRVRSSSASARRRPTPATPTSRRSGRWSTSCRAGTQADARDEEHRAGRHGREGARSARRARPRRTSATSRTPSSSPRAPRSATSCSPTGSSSARSTTADGDAVAALYERLDAPIVRTDVASAEMIKLAVERVPRDADQLHQRDRERLRARRRRRRATSRAGIGLDHRLGPHFLRAGHRLRRLAASRRTSPR